MNLVAKVQGAINRVRGIKTYSLYWPDGTVESARIKIERLESKYRASRRNEQGELIQRVSKSETMAAFECFAESQYFPDTEKGIQLRRHTNLHYWTKAEDGPQLGRIRFSAK